MVDAIFEMMRMTQKNVTRAVNRNEFMILSLLDVEMKSIQGMTKNKKMCKSENKKSPPVYDHPLAKQGGVY